MQLTRRAHTTQLSSLCCSAAPLSSRYSVSDASCRAPPSPSPSPAPTPAPPPPPTALPSAAVATDRSPRRMRVLTPNGPRRNTSSAACPTTPPTMPGTTPSTAAASAGCSTNGTSSVSSKRSASSPPHAWVGHEVVASTSIVRAPGPPPSLLPAETEAAAAPSVPLAAKREGLDAGVRRRARSVASTAGEARPPSPATSMSTSSRIRRAVCISRALGVVVGE
mmetsp:Transcript_5705/g.11606  ORF Transcript_5705/g.11606 Transcript_5705/m.11606 type:complete len:222 (+) Transcript_5705:114-779(+)